MTEYRLLICDRCGSQLRLSWNEYPADWLGGFSTDVPRTTIQTWLDEKRNSADFVKPEPPESRQHFDVWSFQTAAGDGERPFDVCPGCITDGENVDRALREAEGAVMFGGDGAS